jgi:hypothetical protein
MGQFVAARFAMRQDLTHPLDIIASGIVLACFHTAHAALVNAVARYVPLVPPQLIAYGLSYATSEIMHEFIRSGFEAGVFCLFETLLSVFRWFEAEMGEQPVDAAVPQCLTCNICHELLVEPVESLGFFFCRGCFETWLRTTPTPIHPVTGEHILASSVCRPAVLNIVVRKYQRMLQKERMD